MPTTGTPSGRHRVLEPAGSLPGEAVRLDPHPDLWDAEARLQLSHVVLTVNDLARVRARHGHDPTSLRAVLLEGVAERGGMPETTPDAVLVGTLAARGAAWPHTVAPGTLVATASPAGALPCWISDASGWDGASPVMPCRGHAILPAAAQVLAFRPGEDARSVAALAREAGVPGLVADVTHPGDRVAVIGATTTAGALATASAHRSGADLVVGLVTSLQEARLARALGVGKPVVADVTEPSDAAGALSSALGGPADVVAVAVDDAAAVTVATLLAGDGTVLLVAARGHAEHATRTAAALGTSPIVRVDRPAVRDAGAATTALVTSSSTLTELIRWRAGSGPAPAATRPEDV